MTSRPSELPSRRPLADPPILRHGHGQSASELENAFGAQAALQRNASPLFHVASAKGTAPFLVITRGTAARKATQMDFVDALLAAGVVASEWIEQLEVTWTAGTTGSSAITDYMAIGQTPRTCTTTGATTYTIGQLTRDLTYMVTVTPN